MATFLHRTTRQLTPDDGTGDLGSDYIRNPDLSLVAAEPTKYWVIEGDTIRPATQFERDAIDAAELPAAKAARMAEIDARTAEIVTSGLEVATGKVISTSLASTQNLQDIVLGRSMGLIDFPQQISTLDGGHYTITDLGDFVRVATLLRNFKTDALSAGRALRAAVLDAATLAEVAAVEDSR